VETGTISGVAPKTRCGGLPPQIAVANTLSRRCAYRLVIDRSTGLLAVLRPLALSSEAPRFVQIVPVPVSQRDSETIAVPPVRMNSPMLRQFDSIRLLGSPSLTRACATERTPDQSDKRILRDAARPGRSSAKQSYRALKPCLAGRFRQRTGSASAIRHPNRFISVQP
jgi:hypothetical protein